MLFSLLEHYLEIYITDTALKVSHSLYCFTTSISHGVENYFPRLRSTASLMLFFDIGNGVVKLMSIEGWIMKILLYYYKYTYCSNENKINSMTIFLR